MKLSAKMERCGLSPMRKYNPYADKATERGIKIYHLNIGQPDVKTPDIFYQALKEFADPVLSYAPSGGVKDFGLLCAYRRPPQGGRNPPHQRRQ